MEKRVRFARIVLLSALTFAALPGWSATNTTPEPKQPKQSVVVEASVPRVVNVNTADAATLATVLKGVGNAKAEAIVAHRKSHGPFKSAEQLAEVKGIGNALVARNRDRIVVK